MAPDCWCCETISQTVSQTVYPMTMKRPGSTRWQSRTGATAPFCGGRACRISIRWGQQVDILRVRASFAYSFVHCARRLAGSDEGGQGNEHGHWQQYRSNAAQVMHPFHQLRGLHGSITLRYVSGTRRRRRRRRRRRYAIYYIIIRAGDARARTYWRARGGARTRAL
eukprot:SAG31_NODE_530_length_14420_cov_4.259968_5_plen_167_part_00